MNKTIISAILLVFLISLVCGNKSYFRRHRGYYNRSSKCASWCANTIGGYNCGFFKLECCAGGTSNIELQKGFLSQNVKVEPGVHRSDGSC